MMVILGGATRLTDSGLSIVEWRPVAGVVPPLSDAAWTIEFDKYKTSSEYELANKGMTLADALSADPRVSARIDRPTIERLTSPKNYLGLAPEMVDHVLASGKR